MLSYLIRRILLGIFTVWVISMLSFAILQLPENQVIEKYIELARGGELDVGNSDETLARLKAYLGADQPLHIRYFNWVWPMLTCGELGLSFEIYNYAYERTVKETIGDRIWTTIALTGFTILVTWTLAIPIGIYSAVRQHSVGDYVFTFLGFPGLPCRTSCWGWSSCTGRWRTWAGASEVSIRATTATFRGSMEASTGRSFST